MDFSILKDIVITVSSVGGLSLGIYNYRRERQKDKVILTVKPISFHFMNDGHGVGYNDTEIQDDRKFETLGVKVINLSKFDITINEVGFKLTNNVSGEKLAYPNVFVLNESKNLPIRLPSRESVLMAFNSKQLPDLTLRKRIESVYVATGCDLFFYGQGNVLKDFIDMEIKNS